MLGESAGQLIAAEPPGHVTIALRVDQHGGETLIETLVESDT